jgi:hypothetical protein
MMSARVHDSASRGVETVGDLVELVREQVPIEVERHGRGLVSEHLLHDLHVRARRDR